MARPQRNQFKAKREYTDILRRAIREGGVYLDDKNIAAGLGKLGAKTEAFMLQRKSKRVTETYLVPKPGLRPVNHGKNSTIWEF